MKTLHKKRLLKLANLIEREAKQHKCITYFDMATFGYRKRETKRGPVCSTAACALGTAVLSKEFENAGLRGRWRNDAIDPKASSLYIGYATNSRIVYGAFDAGARVFGLTDEESECLFTPHDGHEMADEVAANIRRFVETGELP